MNTHGLSPHAEGLHHRGVNLKEQLVSILDEWPRWEYSTHQPWKHRLDSDKKRISAFVVELERWFNSIRTYVLRRTVHDRKKLQDMLSELKRIIFKAEYKEAEKPEAEKIMDEALSLILSSAPLIEVRRQERRNVVVNKAFIVMPPINGQADLGHIRVAIKEVCSRFGIQAPGADHNGDQQKITNGALKYMAEAEFVIADLTTSSPEVIYAAGYAKALNLHPILLCKVGTRLPFDLAVHDVSEYETLADFKTLLHDRLQTMLGRKVQ